MRMMRKNSRLQKGRVEGHGSRCPDCKPDEPLGRAAEKNRWRREELDDIAYNENNDDERD